MAGAKTFLARKPLQHQISSCISNTPWEHGCMNHKAGGQHMAPTGGRGCRSTYRPQSPWQRGPGQGILSPSLHCHLLSLHCAAPSYSESTIGQGEVAALALTPGNQNWNQNHVHTRGGDASDASAQPQRNRTGVPLFFARGHFPNRARSSNRLNPLLCAPPATT